jgi:hypothetical protein
MSNPAMKRVTRPAIETGLAREREKMFAPAASRQKCACHKKEAKSDKQNIR